jgi:glycosyltransferase involved in cell wall biosynthesis
LAECGHDVSVASIGAAALPLDSRVRQFVYHRSLNWAPLVRNFCFSGEMHAGLHERAREVDVLHSHNLWLMPNIYPGWAASAARKPLVISPRGTLGAVPLQYGRFKKKLVWAALQGPVVKRAACLHATADKEHEEFRSLGLKQPIAVIPNGIDIPRLLHREKTVRGPRRLLFLSRIHQKKGLEILLDAWAATGLASRDWELRIVGVGSPEYEAALKAKAAGLKGGGVSFVGPRYGAQKSQEYAEADLFVLPSLNENFGIVLAEAMSFGLPVIASTGTPWVGVEAHNCGWFVEPDADDLARVLLQAAARSDEQLRAMGRRGRTWMAQEYSWPRLGFEMAQVYKWLVSGGPRPDCVRIL